MKSHRRPEKIPIAREMLKPPGLVIARNAELRIHRFADAKAARAPRLGQVRRIDMIFGRLAHRRLAARFGDTAHQFVARFAKQRVDAPRLQIAARWRARRQGEDFFYCGARYGIGFEGADRFARGDGFGDVHCSAPKTKGENAKACAAL